jgi:hypothetical protein
MALESANGGLHDGIKTVTIRIFSSHESAELARGNLETHGIACWVSADDCGGMYPNLTVHGGVRLLVRASDAAEAIALLNTQASPTEMDQIETEAVMSPPPETVMLKKPAPGQILFGIIIGIICGVVLCSFYQSASEFGRKTYYRYHNGKRDEAWVYLNGHLIEFLQDRNLDGKWDHWTYYEHGHVARSENDNNFDGKPDETWTYSNGVLVSMQKDSDFNSVPDEFCTYKYGILQQMEMKPNGAKFATQRWIYRNGVLTEIMSGGGANRHFKKTVYYDPFLNPISPKPNKANISTAFHLLLP